MRKFKPLSNIEIEEIMKNKKIKNFRGVYSKDILPKKMYVNESMVINIQDFLDGGGTHWVCTYVDRNSKDVEYFDSYGLRPSDIVIKYMETANKGIVYSSNQIQDLDSVMCGYYCIYFIIERYKGRKMADILLDFKQKPSILNKLIISSFAVSIK